MIEANKFVGDCKPFIDKACKQVRFFTPPLILKPTRALSALLGGPAEIDLDPATEDWNPTRAQRIFTAKTDGLAHPWCRPDGSPGFAYVNPPFGHYLYEWVPKIGREADAGNVIVACLPGQRFDQIYYQQALFRRTLTAKVFVTGRISFLDDAGKRVVGNPYGTILFVFNVPVELVAKAFQPIGLVEEPGHIFHCTNPTRLAELDDLGRPAKALARAKAALAKVEQGGPCLFDATEDAA